MMSSIEQVAQKIMTNGQPLDMNSISQEVLRSVDMRDIEKLASSAHELLPVVASLQANMAGGGSSTDMPDLAQMMSMIKGGGQVPGGGRRR